MSKEKKIVPKSYCKSLELIMQENPDMTSKEVQAEYEYGKKCVELWRHNNDKELHEKVAELKKNKYYKIEYKTGGSGLVIFMEITDAFVEKGQHDSSIRFSSIQSKISNRRVVGEPDGINVETLRKERTERWDNFVTGSKEMETVTVLTKKKYEAFLTTVKNLYKL